MSKLPEAPKLFYSTWGQDFYSEHWLSKGNCWMFAMMKFIEANFNPTTDKHALTAFEKFSGSDLMFIFPDKSQQELVRKLFIEQYTTVAKQLKITKKTLLITYPVDPFKSAFIYVTTEKPAATPIFHIQKISQVTGKSLHKIELESEQEVAPDLFIYYQFFMLPPESRYLLGVDAAEITTEFFTPAFGIPLAIVNRMNVSAKYNQAGLYAKLKELWPANEDIPRHTNQHYQSKAIHTHAEFERLLKGKKVAIFKYNKECYSLLRFKELSPYSISVVFDEKVALDDAAEYMQCHSTQIPVVNDTHKIANYRFDALIVTCAINFESEVTFFKALIRESIARNIPIISLYDDVLQYDIFDGVAINTDNFYHVGLSTSTTITEQAPAANICPTNVLGVFGTDTVQGKFTTQLYLREALKKHLKVAHWATEPTGALLGADKGYSRTDDSISEKQRLTYERTALTNMARQSDLVITGGQNSIIFIPPGTTREHNSSTFIFDTFLPRFIILTVSVDTGIKKIEESIAYVAELADKHGIKCRVVALAMMEGRKIHGGRWTETYFAQVDKSTIATARDRLNESFKLPLFVVPDEVDALAQEIAAIDFSNV